MEFEVCKDNFGMEANKYSIPISFDLDYDDIYVELLDNEYVVIHAHDSWRNYWKGLDFKKIVSEKLENILKEKFETAPMYFVRCTNNIDEFSLIESGELCPSLNHCTQKFEKGLSVADNYGYAKTGLYEFAYFVSGDVIGSGSDDEPILSLKSIIIKSEMMPCSDFLKKYAEVDKNKTKLKLKQSGWSMDAYNALYYPIRGRYKFVVNLDE